MSEKRREISVGQDLVLVGEIGLYGVRKMLDEHRNRLLERFSSSYLEEEEALLPEIAEGEDILSEIESFLPEYKKQYGVTKSKCVGKGGILKTLWEFCDEEGRDPQTRKMIGAPIGCRFRYDCIPVRQLTIEICEYMNWSPYRLWSDNCCILSVKNGGQFCSDFLEAQEKIFRERCESMTLPGEKAGFDCDHQRSRVRWQASVFGRLTEGKQRMRTDGTETAYLSRESYDEYAQFEKQCRG